MRFTELQYALIFCFALWVFICHVVSYANIQERVYYSHFTHFTFTLECEMNKSFKTRLNKLIDLNWLMYVLFTRPQLMNYRSAQIQNLSATEWWWVLASMWASLYPSSVCLGIS